MVLPEGSGRFLVRSIRASCSFSCTWFSTDAPQASRKIAESGRIEQMDTFPEANTHAAKADNVTESEIVIRINSGKIREGEERNFISGFSGIQ